MEDITPQKNEIATIIETSGLNKTESQVLLEKFTVYFELAAEWERKADALEVNDISQKANIKTASEGRKFIKAKLSELEDSRVNLKEESLRKGQTIDSIARILKNLLIPIKDKLEAKEKFAERLEATRKSELKEKRESELTEFEAEFQFVDLANMPEENYKHFLENARLAQAQRIESERKANEERIRNDNLVKLTKERFDKVIPYLQFFDQSIILGNLTGNEFADLLDRLIGSKKAFDTEQENIKLENERLKKEAEQKEIEILAEEKRLKDLEENRKKIRATRSEELRPYIVFIRDYNGLIEKDELEYQKEFEEIRIAAKEQWKQDRFEAEKKAKEDAEKEAELEKARQNNLRLDKELREKIEKEQKDKEELEAREELELPKGDDEKLESLLNDIKIITTRYSFKSKKYQNIQKNVNELLDKTVIWANTKK